MKYLLTIILLFIFYSNISSSNKDYLHYATEYDWMTPKIYRAIEHYGQKYKINPRLIAAVINDESNGKQHAVSRHNAMGLMQVMPFHFRDGEDPFNINTNINKGCSYLRLCKLKSNNDMREMLRMYNQGLHGKRYRYRNWKYVDSILNNYVYR